MDDITRWALWLILGVNLLTLLIFLIDKLLACGKKSRVPETVLLTLCMAGGSLGGLLGMTLFRHKVNAREHPAFVYVVPVVFWIHLAAGLYFVIRGI